MRRRSRAPNVLRCREPIGQVYAHCEDQRHIDVRKRLGEVY